MGEPKRTIRLDDLIFKATDALLIGPDYTAVMQICDVLNNRKERVPLAVGVFKERLKHREKDVILRTLELLDAVTKNVPESVQYVGSKDFLSILKKMATNKKTDFLVKETILAYIQSCALAFKTKGSTHFKEAYDSLRKEGVSFPAPEKEAVQLYTRTSPAQSPKVGQQHQQQHQQASSLAAWQDETAATRSPSASWGGGAAGRAKSGRGGRTSERSAGGSPLKGQEKLLLAFSSGGVGALEQELSLLQNSIELAEDILRNARSKLDLQGNDVLEQVLLTCLSTQPQVQSLLAVPSPPMTEDMVAALLYANDRLLAVQSLHQSLLNGERVGHNARPNGTRSIPDQEESSSGGSSSSSEEEEEEEEDIRTDVGGLAHRGGRTNLAQQTGGVPVPQLLRGPPKARVTTAYPHHSPHPPSSSSDDLLDEFAALALRHHSPPQQLTSPSVTLPPQPYPLAFPYPASVLSPLGPTASGTPVLGYPAAATNSGNPFVVPAPSAYYPSMLTPSYAPAPLPTASPAASEMVSYYQPQTPFQPQSQLPFQPQPQPQLQPQPHSQPQPHFQPQPVAGGPAVVPPSGWSGAPAPAPSSIQDDFDLLFGKRQ